MILGGGSRCSKWQGISHIMAFQASYTVSPGQPSSGHQATDPCPPINTPLTRPAFASVDVLKLKNNYRCCLLESVQKEKNDAVVMRIVCLLLLVTKVNMSMVQASVCNLKSTLLETSG